MTQYDELKDFILTTTHNQGLMGKSLPTFEQLAFMCNEKGLTTPRNCKVILPTIQRVIGNKQNILNKWEEGRKEFLRNNPTIQPIRADENGKYNTEQIESESVMENFRNTMPVSDPSIEQLNEFCKSVCRYNGKNNTEMPTMNDLAICANKNGYTSTRGKLVTTSTIQRAISSKEMRDSWSSGKAEWDIIQNPNMAFTPTGEKVNTEIEKKVSAFMNPTDSNDNATLMLMIKRFFEGKGFMSQKKPSTADVCEFMNQQGYRTPVRMSEWTVTSMLRFIQNNSIDVQHEWMQGIKRANEYMGKSNDIRHAISEVAYEWGLYGGVKQPSISIISEQLYHKNFQTEEGKRLPYSYLVTLIRENNIPVFDRWNEGVDELMRIGQEQNQQEKLGEEWAEEIKEEKKEKNKLQPIQPKPEQTEAEREFEAWQIENMRKGAQDRANGIVPEWFQQQQKEQQPPFPAQAQAQAQPLEQEPEPLTVIDESTPFNPASLHMLNRLLFPPAAAPAVQPVLPPVAVADASSIEGTPETTPDPVPAPPDPHAPSTPDPSPIPKDTPDEWKAWVTSSSFKPLNDEDD